MATAVAALLLSAVLELVGPWLTKIALDQAIPQGNARLLAVLAGLFVASVAAAFALEYVETILSTWVGQRVMYDLRMEVFRHLQRLSLRFFDRNPVGRLLTRVTQDIEALNEMFSTGVVTIVGDVFALSLIVAAMLAMDWELALVTFSVLPLVVLVTAVFRLKARDAYREIRLRLARLNAFLAERTTGMAVVQLFNREGRELARFQELDGAYLRAHLRSIRTYALFFPAVEVLAASAMALIIWHGGRSILEGTATVGVIAAFLQYARRFFRPIQDLTEKYNALQSAMASSERVFKLLDTAPGVKDPERPLALPKPVRGAIEFRDVWFAYNLADTAPPDVPPEWVLKGVSFRVEPGEAVALVGHTGAGKTTAINLLMRFYDIRRGAVLLDGVDVRRMRQSDLRSQIALVLQDIYLFSGTVRENIRMGRDQITDEAIEEAARRVGFDPLVRRLPKGYDQPVGERGSNLSMGERQLLSFARALVSDPPILVLDEATSSVDSEIEARIQAALAELMRGRTTLVIAHRLSTVQHAHRILVLHHGELREEGTHEELLLRGGIYAKLYELQFARTTATAAREA
ncbi:MAG: ABC transporter ATP-binding protein [Gemmatimonadetes bacterium]|nr:ABC transporter ATP-binding protein [Gemmatimonadota bacterium]